MIRSEIQPFYIYKYQLSLYNNEKGGRYAIQYKSDTGVECIDAIRAALGPEGFRAHCRATVIKYLWREKWDTAEDAKKAAWYLNKLVESYEDDSDSTH